MFAQRPRPVEDAHAVGLGAFKQPGGGQVFEIEGRILAHDHRVEGLERQPFAAGFAVPVVVVRAQVQMHRLAEDAAGMVAGFRGRRQPSVAQSMA